MIDDETQYSLRRAAEERKLSRDAASEEARLAHRGMADAYEARARGRDRTTPPVPFPPSPEH